MPLLNWPGFLSTARWPAPCLVCGIWCAGGLCQRCVSRFAAPELRCRTCATVLLPSAGPTCISCLKQPPPIAGVFAAVDYAFPWASLLGRFKFSSQPELARILAGLLASDLQRHAAFDQIDWIVPIPLARARLQERGYNQSLLLARQLVRITGKPCHADLLLRWRHTATQSALPHATDRRSNLAGAFMPAPHWLPRLRGRRIALVDDVMTTGTTLHEAATCLRNAGAAEVWGWVVARTPPPGGDNPDHVSHRPGST